MGREGSNLFAILGNFVRPEDFDSDEFCTYADGRSDDSTAFQKAIATGKPIMLNGTKSYLLNSPAASVTDRDLFIIGNGAEIIMNHTGRFAFAVSKFTDIQSVSAISNTTRDLTGESSGTSNTTAITVTDSSVYPANTIFKLFSDDKIPGPDPADNERYGEFLISGDQASNIIYTRGRIDETPTTGIKVAKLNSTPRLYIRDLTFINNNSATTVCSQLFAIQGYYKPVIENVTVQSWGGIAIEFRGCYVPMTRNCSLNNLYTNAAGGAFGYGVIENSCEGGIHEGLTGENTRHLYTTGCTSTSVGDNNVIARGRTRNTVIANSHSHASQSAGFDTHADAKHVTFIGCVSTQAYNGAADGGTFGYQLRGISCRVVDSIAVGGFGFGAVNDNVDSADPNQYLACFNPEYINCKYVTRASDTGSMRAFECSGKSTAIIRDIVIDGLSIDASQAGVDGSAFVYLNYGDALVRNIHANVNFMGSSTGRFFQLINGSSIFLVNPFIDISPSTGTNATLFLFSSASCTVTMKGGYIKAGSATWRIANYNSFVNTCRVYRLDYDAAPSATALNRPGGDTFLLTYDDNAGLFFGSAAFTPGTITDGSTATVAVTVTGAALGDSVVERSFSNDVKGCILSADVTATNTVTLVMQNETGSNQTITDGTVYVSVRKRWRN